MDNSAVSSFLEAWVYPGVYALLLIALGFWVSRIVGKVAVRSARSAKLSEALARFLGQAARYLVITLAVITAAAEVGIETTSLVALLGSAGLAVGLALQGTLSHFASGVMLLVFRPFDIDDKITAAGHTGKVAEIGMFATTLTTATNETIIIPNGAVAGGSIVNHTRIGICRASVSVGVAYGSDVGQVMEVLRSATNSVEAVLDTPPMGVAFVDLGASSIDFQVNFYTLPADFVDAQGAVRWAIYDGLNAAGVDIPYQTIVVQKAEN
jgi:small conductance mechanosensitive channel